MSTQVNTIAHRYGNNLQDLEKAMAHTGIDAVECDVWFTEQDKFSVHHKKKFLPFLLIGFEGWKGRIRLVCSLKDLWLEEVLHRTANKIRIVLDVKGEYSEARMRVFIWKLMGLLKEFHCSDSVLIAARTITALRFAKKFSQDIGIPTPTLYFSIKQEEELLSLDQESRALLDGICLHKRLLLGPRAQQLLEQQIPIDVYAVNEQNEALGLLLLGASSITSDKLELLEGLKPHFKKEEL